MGRPLVVAWQESIEELREAYRREQDAEVRPRLHALLLLREGRGLREIAALIGVHYVTLQQWIAWYREGGLTEVRRHKQGGRQGRPSLLSVKQRWALVEEAQQGNFRTAQDVQEWLMRVQRVSYTHAGVVSLLRRLRWKPKMPRPQAMHASLVAQEEWKKGGSLEP